jgi:hypothetical protein
LQRQAANREAQEGEKKETKILQDTKRRRACIFAKLGIVARATSTRI